MCTRATIVSSAILALLLSSVTQAVLASGWMLVSMDGKCVPMSAFNSDGPPVASPEQLVLQLREEGRHVTSYDIPVEKGRAVAVELRQRAYNALESTSPDLVLVFTTANNCQGKQQPKLGQR